MSEDHQRPRRGLPPDSHEPVAPADAPRPSDDAFSDAPPPDPAGTTPAGNRPFLDLQDSWFRAEHRQPDDPANGAPRNPDLEVTPPRGIRFEQNFDWNPDDLKAEVPPTGASGERPVDVAALMAEAPAPTSSPETTWLAPEHAAPSAPDDHQRKLRTSILLTVASTVLPGSGLLGAPQRWLKVVGGTVAGLALLVAGTLGWMAINNQVVLAKFAASSSGLTLLSVGAAIFAVVWVSLIAATHIVTRPPGTAGKRKILGAVLVTALAFCASAPSAVAARYARDAYLLVSQVLPDAGDVKATSRPSLAEEADPWEGIERVNVLLLGADGDASRTDRIEEYGIRTDTIMVASIDTATGDTTLIQIPRNVQYTPFPEGSEMAEIFPDGFRGLPESDYWVNGIWERVTAEYPDAMGDVTYPGAEALKQGVEGITGLKMDYFVMLNIDGLKELIDAMGGVTVNINQELAIGGSHEPYREPSGYLTPGPNQKLNGYNAMWYARSRFNTDDYNRMARQSCLVDAIIDQANPQTLLTSFEPIAAASADLLTTDIPQQDLSAFIDLAFRVKDADVSRLVFTNGKNGYSYANPDFEAMQKAVAKAIKPKKASTPKPSATATKATSKATTASPSATATATATLGEGAQTVADACAYTGDVD